MKKNAIFIFCLVVLVQVFAIAVYFNYSTQAPERAADTGQALGASNKHEERKDFLIKDKIQTAEKLLSETPNPIKDIKLEGLNISDPLYIESSTSLKDMDAIYNLSLAFLLTNETKYSLKAKEFLLAWAKANISKGNPINDTHIEEGLFGYSWIKHTFSLKEQSQIDAWLNSIARKQMSTPLTGSQSLNNWQSHRLMIVGLIGYITKNDQFITYAEEGYKNHIEKNLNNDGSSYDFIERDSLLYHSYNLNPLLTLARAARLNNTNLYDYQSSNGASLKKSVEFLIPYLQQEKFHNEFVNSSVLSDRKLFNDNSNQNENDHGQISNPKFDIKRAVKTMEIAYAFDHQKPLSVVKDIQKNSTYYPTFQILIYELPQRTNSGIRVY